MKKGMKKFLILIEIMLVILMVINSITTGLMIVKVCTAIVIIGSVISITCIVADEKCKKDT